MKVLDIAGAAGDRFKDAEVFREHIDGQCYDEIVTYRSLSSLPFAEAVEKFQEWASLLEPGGVIHVFEPSAEWFAQTVLGGVVPPYVQWHIFGDGNYQFRSAWTMALLRDLLAVSGLVANYAFTEDYVIGKTKEGQNIYAQQHVVVAFRPGKKVDNG